MGSAPPPAQSLSLRRPWAGRGDTGWSMPACARVAEWRQAVGGESGFTLIEVLVALTILSISITVLLAIFLQGLDRARESSNEASARVLAQSLVTQAKAAPNLAFGTSSGTVNGFSWRTQIMPYGSDADRSAWQSSAAQIVATVTWHGDGRLRSISLSALRLLAKPGSNNQNNDDDQ